MSHTSPTRVSGRYLYSELVFKCLGTLNEGSSLDEIMREASLDHTLTVTSGILDLRLNPVPS